jgi:alpha-beta hydrolase superfamily lysophospholipase
MRRPLRDTEALVFTAASAVGLLHGLDDAFVHRGAGVGLGTFALAAALAIAAALGGAVAFPRLRPGLRAVLALTFGALAATNGAMHLRHVMSDGLAGGDVTGLLALAAGLVLVGLAAVIPWRHRGRAATSAGRRWAARVLAPVGVVLVAFFVVGPAGMGLVSAHKGRHAVGPPPDGAYADVTFRAADGLRISGWYRPSRNGAAVLVLHGGGSDRRGAVRHARMLARHGYGVLLYDARGRGDSEGAPNDYGWGWPKDVAGAMAFLRGRPDVHPRRIGAVGLSTGADVLIEAAARRHDIAALVTDGAAAGSFEDWHRLRGDEAGAVPGWVMFTTLRVLSPDPPGPPLQDMMRRMRTPTLLVSAGRAEERDFNVLYDRAARPGTRVEHWNLPHADHTRAIRQAPAAYERRVVGFLDKTLLRGAPVS